MSKVRPHKLKTPLTESERYFGVVLEDINSKFDKVLSGHVALDRKFDKKFDLLKSDIDLLKVGQQALMDRMGDLESGQKLIFDYLKRIDDEIQELKQLLFKKADLERLERLEQRVAHVELVVKKYYDQKQ